MKKNNERDHKVSVDTLVANKEHVTPRHEENIEKNSSSKVIGSFVKKHGRTSHAFGDGHEPGTLPGAGV